MKKKTNRATAGESIAETLVAVLIMALVFLMLSSAVVSAARVNSAAKNESVAPAVDSSPGEDYKLTITISGHSPFETEDVKLYTANGYYYYEYSPSAGAGGD